MRTKEFEVPTGILTEFANLLIDHNLTNEIIGVDEAGTLTIAVRYENKEKGKIFSLIEFMDDYEGNSIEE